ncbi:TM2 domain-containing protein almondex [Frankliniella fusca]|uniref:TM2 domain-containing protein almondex n=1 Tax=Frankliniella fusca TaxID=407009 RepID=A0AAE1HKY6_9NEOP|nr:TM2 domain-containing protein almondex [Frankliniella fusca]
MNLTYRTAAFCLFMSSIIGICGVQQENVLESPSIAPNMTGSISQNKDNGQNKCPPNLPCSELPAHCLNCSLDENCVYGRTYNITCTARTDCLGDKILEKSMVCRYCYQTDHWEHTCIQKANCNSVASPKAYYRTNCSVKDSIICLGNRKFYKNLPCNWTGGYRWSTALALSITLGGFGADRFYLGHWQEGIGKLFSFGGLGVWTLIDVILIALHYLGPADGSLYL